MAKTWPDSPQRAELESDLAACRARLAQGSRTFLAASWVLPRAVREPACALYAFCRTADDAVDGAADAAPAVARLRERLEALYAGRPEPTPEDRAMAALVRRFEIPIAWPLALIDGFAWDAEGRAYETLHDVQAYAARVAGTVGAMMAALMGARSRSAVARACDLGVAMQLSNIARDVGEDAAMGRLYLPRAWLRRAGIDPEAWLAEPRFSPALAGVVQRLLREADALYARAAQGVAELPLTCRPGINAARMLYREIGLEVERRGLDSVSGRAVVSPARKLVGLAKASSLLWPVRDETAAPPLAATAFLVDALPPEAAPAHAGPAWWQVRARLLRTLEIMESLERRDRARRARWADAAPTPT